MPTFSSLNPVQHTLHPSFSNWWDFSVKSSRKIQPLFQGREDPPHKIGLCCDPAPAQGCSQGTQDRGMRGGLLCVQAPTCSTATENKTKKFPFLYWHNNTHSNFPSAEGDGVIFPILEWCLSDFVTKDSCYFWPAFLNALRQSVLLEGNRNLFCFVFKEDSIIP